MAHKFHKLKLSPPQAILLGFAAMILLGAFLLSLPAASKSGQSIGFVDAIFSATSATCVTGLTVVDTVEHWTTFGKVVILALIQFGALGFMTILTLLMMLMRKNISLRNRLVIQASFNQNNIGGMVRLVKNVILITCAFEAIGVLILTLSFHFGEGMPMSESLYQGIFHAISAFCNSGISTFSDGLTAISSNTLAIATITALFICGGLGFTVWSELITLTKNKQRLPLRNRLVHLSLHTKLALMMTGILLVSGWILFAVLEWHNPATFGNMPVNEKIGTAFFHSANLRTAGFNLFNTDGLTEISKFFSGIFMFIGGSPSGTAGGLKTVTIAIVIFSMISVLRGRNNIEAFGRTLPIDLLQKALTVICTVMIVVVTSTIILYFTEQTTLYPHTFWDILVESCSAATSAGISTGITPYLSTAGKIVISLCMFLGRLGPITVVVALSMRLNNSHDGTSLPEERVIIG